MKSIISSILIIFICLSSVVYAEASVYNESKYDIVIPAVMYHKVSDLAEDKNNPWCVSSKILEDDFKEYLDAGFTPITASEYSALSEAYKKFTSSGTAEREVNLNRFLTLLSKTPNPMLITFDDGYSDGYDIVLPLLKKYKVKINIALVGQYSASSNAYLSADKIKEMSESGYVEFGNHSYSLHDNSPEQLRKLYADNRNSTKISDDITKNEEFIRNITGKRAGYFAYPSGVFSKMTESILDRLGIGVSLATDISENFAKLSDATRTIARYNRSPDISSQTFVCTLIERIRYQNPHSYNYYGERLKIYKNAHRNAQDSTNSTKIKINYENETFNIYGAKKNGVTYVSNSELNLLSKDIIILLKTFNLRNWFLYDVNKQFNGSETYYPVREFFENSGFRVEYDSTSKSVYIHK